MAKKLTKKVKKTGTYSGLDGDFIIIAGGGFVVIVLIVLTLGF